MNGARKCNCILGVPKPVVQIYYACFNKRVRCVAWQQNKQADPDLDNICFQFMNFISGSVPPFAVTWTNHMQKLFQSASLSAVTSYYSASCLAKVHLPFEEHPKILVASNCITWRRLMAPVKTAGPQNGLCWRQVLLYRSYVMFLTGIFCRLSDFLTALSLGGLPHQMPPSSPSSRTSRH